MTNSASLWNRDLSGKDSCLLPVERGFYPLRMTVSNIPMEGRRWIGSPVVLRLYASLRAETIQVRLRRLIVQMEGGPAYSLTIREILKNYFHVGVGLYTSTPCIGNPRHYQQGTNIGRYSAIAETARTFTRNHTTTTKSTHGLFDNPALGKVKTDLIPWGNLEIGCGVWIDHNAIVLPPTEKIGHGALITAGSVVCGNVPPYAIVSGFPARVVGYRFSKDAIARLLESRWWESPPAALESRSGYFKELCSSSCTQPQTLSDRALPKAMEGVSV